MMKKKRKWLVAILILAAVLLACVLAVGNGSPDQASPEKLRRNNREIDLFVYEDAAYVCAADVEWITELELTPDTCVGEIEQTGVARGFKAFDATTLPKGTEIYSVKERPDFLLAHMENEFVPYRRYAEG